MKELLSLFPFARPYWRELLACAVLMALASAAQLGIPSLAGALVASVVGGKGETRGALVLWIVGALALLTLLNIVVAWVSGQAATRMLAALRVRVYDHVQRLPIAFHDLGRQGDLLALMTMEVALVSNFLASTLTSMPVSLIMAAGATVLMFRIDPALALMVPLLLPAFFIILKLVGRRLRKLAQEGQQAEAEVVAIAEENLEMLPAIKSFGREGVESARYSAQVGRAMALQMEESRIVATLQPAVTFVAGCAAVLLLFFAGQKVGSKAMSTSELFSFLFYAALLTWPVGKLADVYGQVQHMRGTMARLQQVLAHPGEPGHGEGEPLGHVEGEIAFDRVSFAYPGRGKVLRDASFTIAAGETIALTGLNGVGKSTIIALMMRFYDPESGTRRLDGRDFRELRVGDLRRAIGLVPQRALLFNGTIRANIGYALDAPDDSKVQRAAILAQAHPFISALPHGYDTIIGDHGVRLSGGQRQRIALARALVADPRILIFDEATSMFDLDGEQAFVEICKEAMKGRTMVLVTHRPASLALADRILVVNDGGVRDLADAPGAALTGTCG